MASSSPLLPPVLNHQVSFDALDSLLSKSSSSVCFRGFKHGVRHLKLEKSRVSMSASSVGSTIAVADGLFADFKATNAFLFPGQGGKHHQLLESLTQVPRDFRNSFLAKKILPYQYVQQSHQFYHGYHFGFIWSSFTGKTQLEAD